MKTRVLSILAVGLLAGPIVALPVASAQAEEGVYASEEPADAPPVLAEHVSSSKVIRIAGERVTYSDLDLANAKDVARLKSRIRGVAQRACPYAQLTDLRAVRKQQECRKSTQEEAMAEVEALVAANSPKH